MKQLFFLPFYLNKIPLSFSASAIKASLIRERATRTSFRNGVIERVIRVRRCICVLTRIEAKPSFHIHYAIFLTFRYEHSWRGHCEGSERKKKPTLFEQLPDRSVKTNVFSQWSRVVDTDRAAVTAFSNCGEKSSIYALDKLIFFTKHKNPGSRLLSHEPKFRKCCQDLHL